VDAFLLKGPVRLEGSVAASGAKNAALPEMATALLADEPVALDGVPDLADVRTMERLLAGMGVAITRPSPGRVVLDASRVTSTEAPYDLVRTMRASILVLGPQEEIAVGQCKLKAPQATARTQRIFARVMTV